MSIIFKKTVNDLCITEVAYTFACKALRDVSDREFRFDDCTEAEKDASEVCHTAFLKWDAAKKTIAVEARAAAARAAAVAAVTAETTAYAALAALFETGSE